MKLLVVTNDFPPILGGIENYVFSLASGLGSEAVVMTRMAKGWKEFDSLLPFKVIRVPVGNMLPTPRLLSLVVKAIGEEKADAVWFPSPFPLPMLGPSVQKRTGKPYAVTLHGGEFVLTSSLPVVRRALRRSLRRSAVILCESTFVMNEATRFFAAAAPPIEYIPGGVDTQRFAPGTEPAFNSPANGPVVVFVGRLIARKGPATLLASLPAIVASHEGAHLLIVGGGPDFARLRRFARTLGVARSVTFTGPKPWEEIPAYYTSGSIFAMPTRERFWGLETEGTPLACLEAAASGLPSVVGRVGGVTDAVIDGETGLIVAGGDATATASALIGLMDAPEKARRMGQNARRLAEERFSWESVVRTFRNALNSHL